VTVTTPPATLVDLLRERAQERPDARAITFLLDGETEERHYTYGELDEQARRIGARLQATHAPGDRVLVIYPPSLEYVSAFFGALYAGVVPVPAYPPVLNRPSSQITSFVADSGAVSMLTVEMIVGARDALLEQEPSLAPLEWIATDVLDPALADEWRPPTIGPETLAFLQYTSGSTASPKGVMLAHGNLITNVSLMFERVGLSPDTVTVSWLPPYHDAGLIGKVLTPIYGGFPTIHMSPIAFLQRPARWVEAISRYRGTTSAAPNFAYDLCIRKTTPEQREALDLSSWTAAMNTGEPIRAQTLCRFAEAFGPCGFRLESFYPTYGLAENTVMGVGPRADAPPTFLELDRSAYQRNEIVPAAPASESPHVAVGCGFPLPGHSIEIVDPDTRAALGERAIGEIWLSGPSAAQGYWGMPEESERIFRAELADGDERRFMRTGDLGFLDGGELFVAGRLKDSIVIRGRNFHPQDLERTVEQAHAALRPGCGAAFTVEEDDEERLVVVNEVDAEKVDDLDAVISVVREAIVAEHGTEARAVVLIERAALPKTSSGKQRRRACRTQYLAGELPVVAESRPAAPAAPAAAVAAGGGGTSRAPIVAWLTDQIAERAGLTPEQVDRRRPFASFGLGSVEMTNLAGELAAWLRRDVEATLPFDYPTVDRLAAHLAGEDPPAVAAPTVAAPAPATRASAEEAVAVIGVGCRFPGADGPDAFRALLRAGREGLSDVPSDRWDPDALHDPEPGVAGKIVTRRGGFVEGVDLFDASFFGISPREASSADPQQRFLLEVAWEALEHAGQDPHRLAGTSTGIFVGVGTADYSYLQLTSGEIDAVGAYFGTGNAHSVAANRLSYTLDLRGPSVAVDTACSSSLVALHLAAESVRSGESDLALAGGVNLILTPHLSVALSQAGMLSPEGQCKTFDAAADGYVRGEGCGVLVLKRLSDAVRDEDRVLAVVRGSAVNQDGLTSGLTAPNGLAQQAVVRRALSRAGVQPHEVGYVEAHGTGTPLGDPIEVAALAKVVGGAGGTADACWLGSVKANIGHLEAAAGIAGAIKAILGLANRELYPQPNLGELNPQIALDGTRMRIVQGGGPWENDGRPRIAGVSSFGFGGTNAHVVLEEPPAGAARRTGQRERPQHLLTLSARSDEALAELARRTGRALGEHPDLDAADVAHTLNTGRARFEHRLAVVGGSSDDLRARLAEFADGERSPAVTRRCPPGPPPRVTFLLTGQGAQYPGMARELHAASPTFRRALNRCADVLDGYLDASLTSVLFGSDGARLDETAYTQPALFAVEYALAELWRSWGIEPDVLVGHSVGEYVAACLAGAIPLDDALALVAERARLMQELPEGGAMAAVLAPADAVAEVVAGYEDEVSIAAVNGPRAATISGSSTAVAQLMAELDERGFTAKRLAVSHAFHSPLVEPMLDAFEAVAGRFALAPLRLPVASNLTGELLEPGFVPDAGYWRRQARSTVQFASCVEAAAQRMAALDPAAARLFVEIGPRPTLVGLGRTVVSGENVAWVPSLVQERDEWESLLNALAQVHLHGAPVDWKGFDRDYSRTVVTAPTYPFERRRHWIGAPHAPESPAPGNGGAPAVASAPPPAASAPAATSGNGMDGSAAVTREQVLSVPSEARQRLLERYLCEEVSRALGLQTDALEPSRPLTDMGLDSIMMLDIRKRVERALEVPLPVVSIAEGGTIAELAQGLERLVAGTPGE
jgi:acyl transferase domain-containing protein/acyl-CoA synthetase (AMP-forming)/AMP-acid ligase II